LLVIILGFTCTFDVTIRFRFWRF